MPFEIRHTQARRLFSRRLDADGKIVAALPVPIAPAFRTADEIRSAPRLGEHSGGELTTP